MASVWKRLQRVGKHASKFQFVASYQELMVECTKKWQPDKLVVVWTRRSRRKSSKSHSWQPGIKNPYRGVVVWPVPENIEITVTLFKDPHAEEFEDKEWTFVIENESPSGRRKALATSSINMKQYASPMPTQTDVKLKFKPLSRKVVAATLQFSLSCIFLREGKATDEDMQSLASLMSMKQADIGNLDDFEEENEEDEENRVNQEEKAAKITELVNQLNALSSLDEDPDDCLKQANKPSAKSASSSEELISKLNFLEEDDQDMSNMDPNPFGEPDEPGLNPFGDPDEEFTEPATEDAVPLKEEPHYDHNSSNPFETEMATETVQYSNPFDEPEPEPELEPEPDRTKETKIEPSPPRPAKMKNARPIDMSKYLYADTTKNEDEELDESNPFYEPKASPLSDQTTPLQESDVDKRAKRKAPAPPIPTPKIYPEKTAKLPAAVGKELASSPKQQDEERRRQLRERARQLIAEARSGVKMSELPSYNEMAAEKLKERSKAYGDFGDEDGVDHGGDDDDNVDTNDDEGSPVCSYVGDGDEFTNLKSDLDSLGGQNSKHVDLKLKKLLEARPQVVNALSTAAAQKVTNDGTEQEELKNNAEDNRTERLRKATERLRSPVMFKKDSTVRKTQLQSFSQYVENRPEVKKQRSVQEDSKKANEERVPITETEQKPSEDEKGFKDTSQYVVGELAALESEQKQIDTRAALVEKRLRYLMDTGTLPNYTVNRSCKLSVHKLL
ncbi:EH domain-binding protein 1 [Acipenser ruthenus]|uniref:EH domain-binding protein 1 n=1 Tax=Acipenser ruthenus TaxID=7906 RepID=A0A662YTA5_ACIRT|nr:EH domain-binding protein 1 [Acipenser ruthenus]